MMRMRGGGLSERSRTMMICPSLQIICTTVPTYASKSDMCGYEWVFRLKSLECLELVENVDQMNLEKKTVEPPS